MFGGLIGAIAWNLITWYFGLPSSSSHALIGGIVGAMLVAKAGRDLRRGASSARSSCRRWSRRSLAFVVGGVAILILYRIVGRLRPGPVTRGFRRGQVLSGGLLALAHGTNDAQKTMGVIALALVAHGSLPASDPTPPTWVVVSAATAIALGTYAGGWRIIKTMGSRIHKMDPAQGFAAQGAGAAVILASTHFGFPLSTTHTISGAGSAPARPSACRPCAGAWRATSSPRGY